jgi:alanine-glyoxylate transaminase/serine-glyoxylate transaminase/serine-pyruvate transaminase
MDDHSLKVLMIPDPIQPEQQVLVAMGQPVRVHYGPEFRDFYNQTTEYLKKIFDTKGDAFILVGSGLSAINACLGSALSSGEKILVGINGFFGERIRTIAQSYNLEVIPIEKTWGESLDPRDFARALNEHPEIRLAAVVHLETSTTVTNPVAEICQTTRPRGVGLFVDAVSSLGGESFHMDEWGVDPCASRSQKCLGAPPGLAPVAVSARGWMIIDRNPDKGHGW